MPCLERLLYPGTHIKNPRLFTGIAPLILMDKLRVYSYADKQNITNH